MNNPYGADPHYALYPLPEHATGHRIYTMLREGLLRCGAEDCSMVEYRDAFDRRNLVTGPWGVAVARDRAAALLPDLYGRTVLVLGAGPRDAFRLGTLAVGSTCVMLHKEKEEAACIMWAPHPSGRNPWYNDDRNRAAVGDILARLYLGERGVLTWAI